MNTVRTTIILLAVVAVGYLGYTFWFSGQAPTEDLAYEPMASPDSLMLESNLNYLEGLSFDESQESALAAEQAFESEVSAQEEEEATMDAELDELEAMDF